MSVSVLLLIVSLVLAAFAAASETALTSVSRLRMRSLAEEGDRRAAVVVRLHNQPNAYLSTILSVNTVAVIVASTTATLIIANTYHNFPEAAGTAILSAFVLVFCEIAPKSLALRFNERLALILGAPGAGLTRLLRPLVGGLTLISNSLLRAATRGKAVVGPFVTEEELKLMLHLGQQQGVVEYGEQEMIHGILEMTDKTVREVMVPRIDVIAIEANRSLSELIDLVVEHGHSRIPVYEDSMDNIVGVVYAKDLLREDGAQRRQRRAIRSLMREPYFTPEVKHVGELLNEMQERKVHMAVVVEEHGGTAGIVTFEDLIEEIVGPIRDEYDVAEQEEVQFLNDCEVLLNARFPVDDIKDLLHLDVGETESDSIGGLVYERLGEIPAVGATIQLGDATLTVEQVRRQSIQLVRITSPVAVPARPQRRATPARTSPTPADAGDRAADGHTEQMPTYLTEGVILRRVDYGEADRILTVLTREHGKIGVIARGVRKAGSRLAAHTDLFARSRMQLARGRGELDVLTQAETVGSHRAARGRPPRRLRGGLRRARRPRAREQPPRRGDVRPRGRGAGRLHRRVTRPARRAGVADPPDDRPARLRAPAAPLRIVFGAAARDDRLVQRHRRRAALRPLRQLRPGRGRMLGAGHQGAARRRRR